MTSALHFAFRSTCLTVGIADANPLSCATRFAVTGDGFGCIVFTSIKGGDGEAGDVGRRREAGRSAMCNLYSLFGKTFLYVFLIRNSRNIDCIGCHIAKETAPPPSDVFSSPLPPIRTGQEATVPGRPLSGATLMLSSRRE